MSNKCLNIVKVSGDAQHIGSIATAMSTMWLTDTPQMLPLGDRPITIIHTERNTPTELEVSYHTDYEPDFYPWLVLCIDVGLTLSYLYENVADRLYGKVYLEGNRLHKIEIPYDAPLWDEEDRDYEAADQHIADVEAELEVCASSLTQEELDILEKLITLYVARYGDVGGQDIQVVANEVFLTSSSTVFYIALTSEDLGRLYVIPAGGTPLPFKEACVSADVLNYAKAMLWRYNDKEGVNLSWLEE